MSSSFKAKDLFGSGPHRFALGRQGSLVLSNLAMGLYSSGSVPLGLLELDVIVTGRLIAQSESGLWYFRDAIVAELLNPPTPGTLIDLHGRTWTNMSFITYQEADRTDRGRLHSMAYTAVFRRFESLP